MICSNPSCKQPLQARGCTCGACGKDRLCPTCQAPENHMAQGSMYRCSVKLTMKAGKHPIQTSSRVSRKAG